MLELNRRMLITCVWGWWSEKDGDERMPHGYSFLYSHETPFISKRFKLMNI